MLHETRVVSRYCSDAVAALVARRRLSRILIHRLIYKPFQSHFEPVQNELRLRTRTIRSEMPMTSQLVTDVSRCEPCELRVGGAVGGPVLQPAAGRQRRVQEHVGIEPAKPCRSGKLVNSGLDVHQPLCLTL